jgi:hypothetical protein
MKPVVTEIGAQNKPIVFTPPTDSYTFSFLYFQQIQFFGLSETDTKWCVSFLDRLRDFCRINLHQFFNQKGLKDWWRFHDINWKATNIPIQRNDLNWLPRTILDNEEEFPLCQFQVSTTRGRIIGFDYENIFYIVLLDPLHNMQPSGNFNYAVDDCYPLSSHYESLVNDIEILRVKTCLQKDTCEVFKELNLLPKKLSQTNALVSFLDDDTLEQLKAALEKTTLTNIIELGLLEYGA